MRQPLESVLGKTQRASLKIENLIFHIIDPEIVENDHVVFLDEVQLNEKQKIFFLDRLRDIAEGTQYVFKENAVSLKEKCAQLLDSDKDFIAISRQITQDFAGRHSDRMAAGVFVIASVKFMASANEWHDLVLLVKLDKMASFSYRYITRDGKKIAVVEEVPNALSETKAAVQKSAVVDISDHFAWSVLAFDRVAKPMLSDYFQNFLGVTERQQDSQWTRIAHACVKRWAAKLETDSMPQGEDLYTYTGRALNYLQDHDKFDTDAFINAVVKDQDSARKATLADELEEELVKGGVAGQQFIPRPESIPPRLRKQVYRTIEGVTISFEGDKDAVGMHIAPKVGGGKIITIETNKLDIPA